MSLAVQPRRHGSSWLGIGGGVEQGRHSCDPPGVQLPSAAALSGSREKPCISLFGKQGRAHLQRLLGHCVGMCAEGYRCPQGNGTHGAAHLAAPCYTLDTPLAFGKMVMGKIPSQSPKDDRPQHACVHSPLYIT